MINVLIANENKQETRDWRDKLHRAGYNTVNECYSLSEMVHVLAREKVHIVIYSANLIKKPALDILTAAINFFPRVKIVVVGGIMHELLSNMPFNVVFKKNFDCDLGKYCLLPVEPPISLASEEKKSVQQQISLLLGEHFLSFEEAAQLLARALPKSQPSYTVISILSDSFSRQILQIASDLVAEMKNGYALQPSLNETCLILDNSPDIEKCLGLADSLRIKLLKETDATFSIGVSRNRYLAGELYACRKEALRAASSPYLYGQNSVVHINYLDVSDILYIYPEHKEKRLIEQTLDGNRADAVRMLEEIFEVIKKCENLKQGLINKIALKILVGLNISAASRVQEFEKIQMDTISTGKLLTAKSVNDTYLFLRRGIEDFADEMDAMADVRRDILFVELSKLKKQPENISITDLTKVFQTTVSFLNSSIMKNTGSDIFEFWGK